MTDTKIDDGDVLAFPCEGEHLLQHGMSMRQYAAINLRVPSSGLPWLDVMIAEARRQEYAGLAMQGLIANSDWDANKVDNVALMAWEVSDALIAALRHD